MSCTVAIDTFRTQSALALPCSSFRQAYWKRAQKSLECIRLTCSESNTLTSSQLLDTDGVVGIRVSQTNMAEDRGPVHIHSKVTFRIRYWKGAITPSRTFLRGALGRSSDVP